MTLARSLAVQIKIQGKKIAQCLPGAGAFGRWGCHIPQQSFPGKPLSPGRLAPGSSFENVSQSPTSAPTVTHTLQCHSKPFKVKAFINKFSPK